MLQSDVDSIAVLPEELRSHFPKYPLAVLGAVEALDLDLKPEGFVPRTVEVYLNGGDSSSLTIIDGKLSSGNANELLQQHDAFALDIDGMCRYVEIEGITYVDKTEGIQLPEVLVNPVAQADMYLTLGKKNG